MRGGLGGFNASAVQRLGLLPLATRAASPLHSEQWGGTCGGLAVTIREFIFRKRCVAARLRKMWAMKKNNNTPIRRLAVYALVLAAWLIRPAAAQESPYIVTYDHYLEEPGNLEIEYFSTFGTQRGASDFHAFWVEFEYGATAWWTTTGYLDGQTTLNDSTLFTGFRWENRIRLLQREHFINPVVYIEYEQKNGADKILKEVEGHDAESDYAERNASLRNELDHELELKLLLSNTFKGWNFAVNPLAGKNLSPSHPWEFGYAVGASRPLALKASANWCNLLSLIHI